MNKSKKWYLREYLEFIGKERCPFDGYRLWDTPGGYNICSKCGRVYPFLHRLSRGGYEVHQFSLSVVGFDEQFREWSGFDRPSKLNIFSLKTCKEKVSCFLRREE